MVNMTLNEAKEYLGQILAQNIPSSVPDEILLKAADMMAPYLVPDDDEEEPDPDAQENMRD